jgi:hypothetical protein
MLKELAALLKHSEKPHTEQMDKPAKKKKHQTRA